MTYSKRLKAMGLVGFVAVLIGIVLTVMAIGAAAGDRGGTVPLTVVGVAVLVAGLALVLFSRYRLTARPHIEERAQEDPLQPASTDDDIEGYEWRFHRHMPPDNKHGHAT